jgi:hypothetical protein
MRQSSDLLTKLSMLEGGLAQAQADIDVAEDALEDSEARRGKIELRVADAERELEHERARLRDRAVAIYMGGSAGPSDTSVNSRLPVTGLVAQLPTRTASAPATTTVLGNAICLMV